MDSELTLLDTAQAAIRAGFDVIPIRPYDPQLGDKRPAIRWKETSHTRITLDDATKWFTQDRYGLAIAMGTRSNDLMMIELEGRATKLIPQLFTLAEHSGILDLWSRLHQWAETSPSGGWHFYLKVPGNTSGNRKLALNTRHEVIAETRENGGYSIIAPTPGTFHHTGQPWKPIQGTPANAPTFTLDELNQILTLFRTLDQTPPKQPASTPQTPSKYAGITPGDDYENKTSWNDILQPAGWMPVYTQGNETFWRRPGKNIGISASTGHADDRDRLYVWSTSTIFDAQTPYTKFAAYTLLNHAGDYNKAAKVLADSGYGKPLEHPRPNTTERSLDAYVARLTNSSEKPTSNSPHSDKTAPQAPLETSEPQTYTRTDDGNALRFTDTYKNKLRYIPERKTWAQWDGHRWLTQPSNAPAMEAAKNIARNLPENDKLDITHKRRSLSKNAITAIVALGASTQGIYTPIAHFDADPYILNTPNGVINLKTGKLQPPNPETLCLRSTTVAPNWNQPTPRWLNFLAETFAGEPELTNYLQRFLGMAIIGKVLEQTISFWNGAGANGKSTMLNVIQHILGIGENGYTITIPANMFLAGAENHHPAELAQLQGARIAITSETEEGQRFAEARVKLLTGTDLISARFMGKNFFTFTPTHTIIMVSNHEPEVATGGNAFWRRIKKVPFANTVPPEQRNPHLEEELLKEAPGILAWIIDGARLYLQDGLNEPDVVKVATIEYETEQDTVKMFVQEMCMLGTPDMQGYEIPVAKFFDEYETWCRQNAYEPVTKNMLTRKLRAFGVTTPRTAYTRFYGGIRLKWDGENDFEKALRNE